MKIYIFRIMLGLFLFILISMAHACSVGFKDKLEGGRCVDVGQYQIYAKILGESGPLVIFDAGSGDDSSVWDSVAPAVAKFARVLIYDRASFSDRCYLYGCSIS